MAPRKYYLMSHSNKIALPEYFPPLFLFTKQIVNNISVRRAIAHISPINQPWVEMSSYKPAYSVVQREIMYGTLETVSGIMSHSGIILKYTK